MCTRHGNRTIARQPMGPILIAGLEGTFYKESAEPAAVDEEICFDALPARERHRFNIPCLIVQRNILNAPLDTLHATLLRVGSQIACIEARIEVVCVVVSGLDAARVAGRSVEPTGGSGGPRHRELVERRDAAGPAGS